MESILRGKDKNLPAAFYVSTDQFSLKLEDGTLSFNGDQASALDKRVSEALHEVHRQVDEVFFELRDIVLREAKSTKTTPNDREGGIMRLSEEVEDDGPSDAEKAMNAICYVAGACASVWPLGTLICGPTVVGCVVWYAGGGRPRNRKPQSNQPLDVYLTE